MGDWRNADDWKAGFVLNAMKESGVIEYCPHENPYLTGKDIGAAYALATNRFKQGAPGSEEFSGLKDVLTTMDEQLQLVEAECHICNGTA